MRRQNEANYSTLSKKCLESPYMIVNNFERKASLFSLSEPKSATLNSPKLKNEIYDSTLNINSSSINEVKKSATLVRPMVNINPNSSSSSINNNNSSKMLNNNQFNNINNNIYCTYNNV